MQSAVLFIMSYWFMFAIGLLVLGQCLLPRRIQICGRRYEEFIRMVIISRHQIEKKIRKFRTLPTGVLFNISIKARDNNIQKSK